MKVLGADKDRVHGDQTLGNTGGNNNKDAMFDWTRLLSESGLSLENVIGV